MRPFARDARRICLLKPVVAVARMLTCVTFAAVAPVAGPACAQEVALFMGPLHAHDESHWVRAWGVEYQHALTEHDALAFEWINEGAVRDNHRDGLAFQYWRRAQFFDRRLSIAAGIGPYGFFNTTSGGYRDDHGWGALMSVAATWYTASRVFYQLRLNQVVAASSFDSTSLMFGIGYQLDAPRGRGPLAGGIPGGMPSGDQLAALVGLATVNNRGTPSAFAWSVEYRHGLNRYFDATLSWLDEGSTSLSKRRGVAGQLWLRRGFADDRLSLGVGAGPYYAVGRDTPSGNGRPVSLLFTMTAAYDLSRHWFARVAWHRVMTPYDKDSDVFLGGFGYRFQAAPWRPAPRRPPPAVSARDASANSPRSHATSPGRSGCGCHN